MEIDERRLIESGLSPTVFVTLQAIYYKNESIIQYLKNLKIFDKVIDTLETNGYVKITGPDKNTDFIIRKKTVSLFGQNNVNDWYEEWRNLFPAGTNASGYHYRGNKGEVLLKLTKFVEKNPKYSKEEIMTATKNYISRCSRLNSYMMLAHYFIHKKEVGSTLLTELENISTNKEIKFLPVNKMV